MSPILSAVLVNLPVPKSWIAAILIGPDACSGSRVSGFNGHARALCGVLGTAKPVLSHRNSRSPRGPERDLDLILAQQPGINSAMDKLAQRSRKILAGTSMVVFAGLVASLAVACQSNNQGSSAPVPHAKGSLDGNLQRLGYRLPPDLVSGPLMTGMVIDVSTGAVVCQPPGMVPANAIQEVPAANSEAAEIADTTFGVGSNYYRLIQGGAGVTLRGHVAVTGAVHSQVVGAVARPIDPTCDAAVAKLQDEGKHVALVSQVVRADLGFSFLTPQPV
ncbi:MAG: hypothetical protein ACPG77_04155, partial [Nannocystaceae bacterium]